MTDRAIDLASPPGLSLERRTLLAELARRNEADHGSDQIPPFGTNGWYFRWSFAWAPVPAGRHRRLAESVPWLLDVIFTLAGRVRPYHKYLPWELRRHPLPHWHSEDLLTLLNATLDGDPTAIRATFERIESLCAGFDNEVPKAVLTPIIQDWSDELELLRR